MDSQTMSRTHWIERSHRDARMRVRAPQPTTAMPPRGPLPHFIVIDVTSVNSLTLRRLVSLARLAAWYCTVRLFRLEKLCQARAFRVALQTLISAVLGAAAVLPFWAELLWLLQLMQNPDPRIAPFVRRSRGIPTRAASRCIIDLSALSRPSVPAVPLIFQLSSLA